jgi:hypothetical protein
MSGSSVKAVPGEMKEMTAEQLQNWIGSADFGRIFDLTAALVAAAPLHQQIQMLGEWLYPLILQTQPELAGQIIGKLLELDISELLLLLQKRSDARGTRTQTSSGPCRHQSARRASCSRDASGTTGSW